MTRTSKIQEKVAAVRALRGGEHAKRRSVAEAIQKRDPRYRKETLEARATRYLAILDSPQNVRLLRRVVQGLRNDGITDWSEVEARLVMLESHADPRIAEVATDYVERLCLDEATIKARLDAEVAKDPEQVDMVKLDRLLRRATDFEDLDS